MKRGMGLALMAMITAGTMSAQAPVKAEFRASMDTFQLPSHGALLNAFVYVAAGEGPHPVVVLLHGFPGNEKNLDVAQAIRRAGWDVLYLDYRGSWGSPGDFSFMHCIEDTAAAVAYLRKPENAKRLRADPARIVLIGHSMGGFMTVQGAAADPGIMGFVMISAADLGSMSQAPKDAKAEALKGLSSMLADEGMAPLAGCTPDGLAAEVFAHGDAWTFTANAKALKSRPGLVITSDDGLVPGNDAFVAALRAEGDTHVKTRHLATDHSYSDKRIELTDAVVGWLEGLSVAAR